MLNKQTANDAIVFLSRCELKGNEVQAFNNVINAISQELKSAKELEEKKSSGEKKPEKK